VCGIAGLLGNFPPDTAARMGDRIAHRGPDSDGLFIDSAAGVALAHRRLSIIDLSPAGAQPMVDASGRFTMVYNGEIYNFPALREELVARGRALRGHSDSEVILELFADDGPAVFARLNGIFAAAIWDARDRALWLVRDGLGVKPLYIAETPGGLGFSSEMKALLELPDLDRTIDRTAVAAYLGYLYSPGTRTMFESVRKLTPGTWLRIDADGSRHDERFYALPDYAPDPTMDARAAIAGTGNALRAAVERQMIADVEVGAFLSGGLDSSAVVAFARDLAPGAMQCFTIDYQGSSDDRGELATDLPYARSAAKHLGVVLHEVSVDASMADQFADVIYTLDEPQADMAAINSLMIAALARRHGIKVLLSGAGGDDVFTGYRRHKAAALDRWTSHIPAPARAALASAAAHLPGDGALPRRLRKLLSPLGESREARLLSYFEWLRLEQASALIAGGDTALANGARVPMIAALEGYAPTDPVERALRLEQLFFLTDHNLNYTDKTGMAVGVEVRVPFLDLDLLAFAARMPTRFKLHRGETKWALRKAMEPYLPHEIIYRPKTGFGVPLRSWMRNELRPLMDELLSPDAIKRRGLFDAAAVATLREDTERGTFDGYPALLALISIELWCRAFVDRAAGASALSAIRTPSARSRSSG
jgi:asparagine synthase (glutamine-hydrolysing)